MRFKSQTIKVDSVGVRALNDEEVHRAVRSINWWICVMFASPLLVLLIFLAAALEPAEVGADEAYPREEAGYYPAYEVEDLVVNSTSDSKEEYFNNSNATYLLRVQIKGSDATAQEGPLALSDAVSLLGLTSILFLPPTFAIYFAVRPLKGGLQRNSLSPFQQKKIIMQLRSVAGVQALIGAAIATTVVQLVPGPVEMNLLIATLVWTSAALFYFRAYFYQVQIEHTSSVM